MTLPLLLHFVSTVYMVGLIWMVQVVHYPLMAKVGHAEAAEYAKLHQQWTTWVVIGPMLIEISTAVYLLVGDSQFLQSKLFWVSVVLLGVIWLSTAFLQVPIHQKLLDGHSVALVSRLVWSNWIRTIAWSARAAILSLMLLRL